MGKKNPETEWAEPARQKAGKHGGDGEEWYKIVMVTPDEILLLFHPCSHFNT